jgi:hypothetical protein
MSFGNAGEASAVSGGIEEPVTSLLNWFMGGAYSCCAGGQKHLTNSPYIVCCLEKSLLIGVSPASEVTLVDTIGQIKVRRDKMAASDDAFSGKVLSEWEAARGLQAGIKADYGPWQVRSCRGPIGDKTAVERYMAFLQRFKIYFIPVCLQNHICARL